MYLFEKSTLIVVLTKGCTCQSVLKRPEKSQEQIRTFHDLSGHFERCKVLKHRNLGLIFQNFALMMDHNRLSNCDCVVWKLVKLPLKTSKKRQKRRKNYGLI